MAKNKIAQWAEIRTFERIIQPKRTDFIDRDFSLKGRWAEEVFGNNNPIVIELGCGKGEYTVGLARKNPQINFIGMDIKGHRMWRGAKTAHIEGLDNVGFLRGHVDNVADLFGENEISEIWLTFSDPQKKKPRKRLTSSLFIDRYRKIMSPGGIINLKTDSDLLYEYSLEQCESQGYEILFQTNNLYEEGIHTLDEYHQEILSIKTYYEQIWLKQGIKIKYLKFKID